MKVVVCGTRYGSVYVDALLRGIPGLALGAILGRGSERTRAIAARARVPFVSSAASVPDDVQLACVAVGRQAGLDLAAALLERGVHVLIEHPRSDFDVAQLLSIAARRGARVHVAHHFADVEPIRAFIAACRPASARLTFLHALTTKRLLYSVVDIFVRILGPAACWTVRAPHAPAKATRCGATETVTGVLAGVPFTISCPSFVSDEDDGSDELVTHNITVGAPDRTTVLVGSAGPVLALPARSPHGATWSVVAAGAPTYASFQEARRLAVIDALEALANDIEGGGRRPSQETRHLVAVSGLWRELATAFGRSFAPPAWGSTSAGLRDGADVGR